MADTLVSSERIGGGDAAGLFLRIIHKLGRVIPSPRMISYSNDKI